MAVSIFDENTPHDKSEFTPFDESRAGAIQRAAYDSTITDRKGTDTSAIDSFRQGIELTSQAYRFKGLGAKIWAGNVEGYTTVRTFGQSPSFTDFEGTIAFEELPRFDPVSYLILGPGYPLPIVFNEGPQQNDEPGLQPFTIPFRNAKQDIEGTEKARGIHASLEDGNQDLNHIDGRNSRVEQFIPFETAAVVIEPFLDEGQEYYGSAVSGSIVIEGFLWEDEGIIAPYDDEGNQKLINRLNTTDAEMLRILSTTSCSFNVDDDLRGSYGHRSAPAGSDVYGLDSARAGTDSIAYRGMIRGS